MNVHRLADLVKDHKVARSLSCNGLTVEVLRDGCVHLSVSDNQGFGTCVDDDGKVWSLLTPEWRKHLRNLLADDGLDRLHQPE